MKPLPSLRQLRYLAALAEHGHFGRAAAACAVTQSAFSAAIQELESVLGSVSLVERSKRHVLVTPLGAEIVERARRILDEAEALVERVAAAGAPFVGRLCLGVIPTIGPYLLPRLMPLLRRKFPALHLFVREEPTAALVERLVTGQLDLLLLAKPYELGEAIETVDLAADEILVACAVGHRWARARRVDRESLRGEPLLLLEDGHCLRSQALAACALGAADRNEVFQGTSLRTLVQMVGAGLGVTLIPALAAAAEIAADGGGRIAVRKLAPGRHARSIALAWRRTSGRKAEFRQLGALIAAELGRPAASGRGARAR